MRNENILIGKVQRKFRWVQLQAGRDPLRWLSVLQLAFLSLAFAASAQSPIPFSAAPLTEQGDLSSLMVEGIDRFLMLQRELVRQKRSEQWRRDYTSPEAFNKSIAPQRDLLAGILGLAEVRVPTEMEVLTNDRLQQLAVEADDYTIRAVRWKVIDGLTAEGLLLQPRKKVIARTVIIPDADVLPEVFAGLQGTGGPGYGVARKLAEGGWEVLVPVLASRVDTFSGSRITGRFTNQPHREWIYRQAYVLGRHPIGYELQKVFSAIDWLEARNKTEGLQGGVGVAGHGEGGLLALFAAALDVRISSTLVSGYFDTREQSWREPIYRNIFGFLKTFGDAELAVMAWPRRLVVEHAQGPEVSGPPGPSKARSGAAPGSLTTPDIVTAKAEWKRAKELLPVKNVHLNWYSSSDSGFGEPFATRALADFAQGLNVKLPKAPAGSLDVLKVNGWPDTRLRQERTVAGMAQHAQWLLSQCEKTRDQTFWKTLKGDTTMHKPVKEVHRDRFWDVIGRLPTPTMPMNPRARLLEETEKWTSYEVTLDVWPEVFAWGILVVPKDIIRGEKRPAVVCQHGLEGLPMDVLVTDSSASAFQYYKGFAVRLAERGYVTFAPHSPYRGEDKFRVLQRKANPLGLSLFSVMVGQHQRIVEWLSKQSFVNSKRIGFYGLSYGGKAAMRIPVLVDGYALSICSGDFNEWVRKVATTNEDTFTSYPFTKEYEIPEWNLGHTFNYAEMASLIAPRPFMVERGHYDGVGTDEWVAFEFAKVRRHYDFIGMPGFCQIEYFNGAHTINANETFKFLDRHLRRP